MKKIVGLFLSAAAAFTCSASTGFYQVTIAPTNMECVAYSFNTNTVSYALPNAPDGTQLWVWNAGSQSYDGVTLLFGTWYPNYTLTPGQGFFIINPQTTNFTFTVQGTNLSASSYTMSFPVSTNFYMVGSAYNIDVAGGSDWLECIPNCLGSYQYTTGSYNYKGHNGDTMWFWDGDAQAWSTNIVRSPNPICPSGTPAWVNQFNNSDYPTQFTSPPLAFDDGLNATRRGRAIFLKPAGGTTNWVHLSNGATCQ